MSGLWRLVSLSVGRESETVMWEKRANYLIRGNCASLHSGPDRIDQFNRYSHFCISNAGFECQHDWAVDKFLVALAV